MAQTLVRIYDNYHAAQCAREQLLSSGLPPSHVHLSVEEDEAGPLSNNFILDDKDRSKGKISSFFQSLFASDDLEDDETFPPPQHGIYLLTVDAEGEEEFARAAGVMDCFGTIEEQRQERPSE